MLDRFGSRVGFPLAWARGIAQTIHKIARKWAHFLFVGHGLFVGYMTARLRRLPKNWL